MDIIPIRICSPQKAAVDEAYPDQLYTSPMLQSFFKRFPNHHWPFRHAILSRKYGIMLSHWKYRQYQDEEMVSDDVLLTILEGQRQSDLFNHIYVYWNHRPMTHDKWISLMRRAGYTVHEGRSLDDVVRVMRELEADDQ